MESVYEVGLEAMHQGPDASGVDEIAGFAQGLGAIDVMDANAFDVGGPEGDYLAVDALRGEMKDPTLLVDVGGIRQVNDLHEGIVAISFQLSAISYQRSGLPPVGVGAREPARLAADC